MAISRRKKGRYFPRSPDAPTPIAVQVIRRVSFSDVDPMGILWHGRYPKYFELAYEELGRNCGLSYIDFMREKLRAPIVQFHVDYFAPLYLEEEVAITARLVWCEGARINIEYEIGKEKGELGASGYTVQMFIDHSNEALMIPPPLIERCRSRWAQGEFAHLQ